MKQPAEDRELLARSVHDIDTVFHQAAIVSQVRSIENPLLVNRANTEGTLSVLDESRKARVTRFVHAFSCAVYGNAQLPLKEDMPLAPRTPYAASKAAGEHYCMALHRTYGLGVVCLRYTNVYGLRTSVGQYSGVVVKFLERLLSDRSPVISGDGEQTRDFVYAADVAEATVRAAENPDANGMIINVGTGVATIEKSLVGLALGPLGLSGNQS